MKQREELIALNKINLTWDKDPLYVLVYSMNHGFEVKLLAEIYNIHTYYFIDVLTRKRNEKDLNGIRDKCR